MRRVWWTLAVVVILSFSVLGFVGSRIYQLAPPIPDRVVARDGTVIFGPGDLAAGQDVWRSFGGMEVGSIWGHGAYVAPDWTADWLHRELVTVLDGWARAEHGVAYDQLSAGEAAALRDRLTHEYRANTYAAGTITVSNDRARAIEATIAYYTQLFAEGRATYALA